MGSGKLWSGLKHELRLASSVNGAHHLSGHSTHVTWVALMRLSRLRNSTIAFFTVPAAFLQGASTTRLGASALYPETKELCTCSGPSLLITLFSPKSQNERGCHAVEASRMRHVTSSRSLPHSLSFELLRGVVAALCVNTAPDGLAGITLSMHHTSNLRQLLFSISLE